MGRAKLPRKSTSIDMTAMCDVAFLLLSFFILATKQKAPEIVQVTTPSSISNKSVDKENQVVVTIGNNGKVFLGFGDADKRKEVVENLNDRLKLGLTAADLDKVKTADIFGCSPSQLHDFLNLPADKKTAETMPGIPVQDSLNNKLNDWLESANVVYTGDKMNLLVKGDEVAKYPVFKGVIDAFKKNDLMKFNIITNQQNVDPTSEYYQLHVKEKKI